MIPSIEPASDPESRSGTADRKGSFRHAKPVACGCPDSTTAAARAASAAGAMYNPHPLPGSRHPWIAWQQTHLLIVVTPPSSVGATAGAGRGQTRLRGRALRRVRAERPPVRKVGDGLPRWHSALRRKGTTSSTRGSRAMASHFVPRTDRTRRRLRDDLLQSWGFDLVVLANGAWRDRPLPIDGADAYVSRGLVYQNPLRSTGSTTTTNLATRVRSTPTARWSSAAVASIDVVKILQLVKVREALAARGIEAGSAGDGEPRASRYARETRPDLGRPPDSRGCAGLPARIGHAAQRSPASRPDEAVKSANVRRKIVEGAGFSSGWSRSPVPLRSTSKGRPARRAALCTHVDASRRVGVVPRRRARAARPFVIRRSGRSRSRSRAAMHGELLRVKTMEAARSPISRAGLRLRQRDPSKGNPGGVAPSLGTGRDAARATSTAARGRPAQRRAARARARNS